MSEEKGQSKFAKVFLAPVQPFMGMLVGFFTMLWGLWIALPYWDAFARGSQYDLLASLAHESVWGVLAMIIGLTMIAACWNMRVETIRLASMLHFYFWVVVFLSYQYSDWRHLAAIPALYFACVSGYAYLNLTVRFKKGLVDEQNLPHNKSTDTI